MFYVVHCNALWGPIPFHLHSSPPGKPTPCPSCPLPSSFPLPVPPFSSPSLSPSPSLFPARGLGSTLSSQQGLGRSIVENEFGASENLASGENSLVTFIKTILTFSPISGKTLPLNFFWSICSNVYRLYRRP